MVMTNRKQVTVLIGLDLSAAFDTVCHQTLLQRLQTEFGVSDTVLSWIRSYLTDRKQFVKLGEHKSSETKSAYLRAQYWDLCCSPYTAVR